MINCKWRLRSSYVTNVYRNLASEKKENFLLIGQENGVNDGNISLFLVSRPYQKRAIDHRLKPLVSSERATQELTKKRSHVKRKMFIFSSSAMKIFFFFSLLYGNCADHPLLEM